MKRALIYFSAAAAAAGFFFACNPAGMDPQTPTQAIDPLSGAVADEYYGFARMSVPAATTEVYVVYTKAGGDKEIMTVPVSPVVTPAKDGKDVEPFGTVTLYLTSPKATKVSVFYRAGVETKADENATSQDVYTLTDFPINKITFGTFGETRYVQMPWDFAWYNSAETNWQNTRTYPKDVVFYDAQHNHTLRYKFSYAGNAEGYFLDDAYTIENYTITGEKYNYCGGCGDCPFCMPWGCSCGCGSVNESFVPSGDTTTPEDDAVIPEIPAGIPTVALPEPQSYVTRDGDQTFYHSSGVVMFDDSWPNLPPRDNGSYDYDFNDVVLDYDIEAKTVADNILATDGWREEVKVVLHVRAVGGTEAERVGVVLENFNTDYVASVEEYKTLDSWQNPHGILPAWTVRTLQENSLHYDQFAMQYRNDSNLRPAAEVGAIFRYRESGSGAGSQTYFYINDARSAEHVFNPALKQYASWNGPHTEQYSPQLESLCTAPNTLAKIQDMVYYNTIPGYVNAAGGLYTYTVVYHMKPRAEMDPALRQTVLENMIDAVVNTTAQNFYIVKKNAIPVGLKGYEPLDYAVKGCNSYKAKYEEQVASHAANLKAGNYYEAANGMVWAFKCPTLTKHVWEKQYFGKAYPHYEEWVTSGGAVHSDWYKDDDVDGRLLTCWW